MHSPIVRPSATPYQPPQIEIYPRKWGNSDVERAARFEELKRVWRQGLWLAKRPL